MKNPLSHRSRANSIPSAFLDASVLSFLAISSSLAAIEAVTGTWDFAKKVFTDEAQIKDPELTHCYRHLIVIKVKALDSIKSVKIKFAFLTSTSGKSAVFIRR